MNMTRVLQNTFLFPLLLSLCLVGEAEIKNSSTLATDDANEPMIRIFVAKTTTVTEGKLSVGVSTTQQSLTPVHLRLNETRQTHTTTLITYLIALCVLCGITTVLVLTVIGLGIYIKRLKQRISETKKPHAGDTNDPDYERIEDILPQVIHTAGQGTSGQ